MFERDDREDRSRERSLLAFGNDARPHEPAGPSLSLLSVAEGLETAGQEDAVARHRLARAQREAQSENKTDASPSPLGETPSAQPAKASPAVAGGEATASAHPYDDDQQWKPLIDPMKVVGAIARSKKLIAATTLAGAVLGVALALSTPKKYESTTELIADPRNLQITDHDLTQSGIASDTTVAIVENQVRVLTSGTVLNQVAKKLNLFDDPEFNGQGKGFPGVMTLIRSVLSRDDGPGAGGEERVHAIVIRNLAESLSVERGSKTFVISIGATTESGEKSALIANTMADVFLQTYGKMQSDTASRATDELTGRLDELRKAVETAERKVETFKAEHDLVDAQGRLISDDELLKLNDQLTVARARTLELNAKAASARAVSVDSVVAGTLPEEISSNAMNDLRLQYARLKQEADRADVRLGPRHPERLALDAQLVGARDRIAAELRRIASSLQTDLKRAVQLEQQLSSRLAQLKVRSGDVNSDLVTARELERDANAKRAVYEAFLLRAKQTGEQKDINTANISVISKAFPPLDPAGPSRALTALVGMLLGFASGVGLGAMRGAYESLRETADGRSRRLPTAARRGAVDGVSLNSSPIPPQSGSPASEEPFPVQVQVPPPTPDPMLANPIGTLRAAVSRALQRNTSRRDAADEEVYEEPYEENQAGLDDTTLFAPDAAMQETESPMYPYYPDPNAPFAPQQPTGFPQPQFQQAPQFHQGQQFRQGQQFQQGPQVQQSPQIQQGMYAPQSYPPQAPYYPAAQPMMPPQALYPAPPMQPQPYAPPSYPYAPQPMGYPQTQSWQGQPMPPAYPYAQQMPQQAASMAYAPAPFDQPQAQETAAEEPTPIEEIRASLREFREAVRDLADSRSRRRYF